MTTSHENRSRRHRKLVILVATVVVLVGALLARWIWPPALRPIEVRVSQPELLLDLDAWDAATSEERQETAAAVAAAAPDFELRRLETFTRGERTHEVAIFLHDETAAEFVLVPGGTFTKIGEKAYQVFHPPHEVPVTQPFLLGRTEVSWAIWQRVRWRGSGVADRPVYDLSSSEAVEFCRDAGLDMPTSRQWEHACRAGRNCSDGDSRRSFVKGRSLQRKKYKVSDGGTNALGLFAMLGGVSEWCRNDLSYSGRDEDPLAFEGPFGYDPGRPTPFVRRTWGPRGCNEIRSTEPPDWFARIEGGYNYSGLRLARALHVVVD